MSTIFFPSIQAKFYVINRSSFSGATFSGGYSESAAHQRFTNSAVQRLRDFSGDNLKVGCEDFEVAIANHPRAFLYLDPPYMLKVNNTLYGINGDLHRGFDHQRLHAILSRRRRWVLSYNDDPKIRDLYCDYEVITAAWSYGMNKTKKSSEIIILGK